jgi:predicted RNA binding protein with dsRBD fold (UPF0201 family)
MPTLAQLGDWINPNVPALPEPGVFQQYVLEQPIILSVALIVGGLIVFIAMRSRNRMRTGAIVFAAAALLSAGVYAAGSLVRTDRERLLDAQDRLVDATADVRISELNALLAEDVRVRSKSRLPRLRGGLERDQILATVQQVLGERIRLTEVATIERQAVVDGPNAARTQIYLRVDTAELGGSFTWFAIDWRLGADGVWRAVQIEPLFISGVLPYNP